MGNCLYCQGSKDLYLPFLISRGKWMYVLNSLPLLAYKFRINVGCMDQIHLPHPQRFPMGKRREYPGLEFKALKRKRAISRRLRAVKKKLKIRLDFSFSIYGFRKTSNMPGGPAPHLCLLASKLGSSILISQFSKTPLCVVSLERHPAS